MPVRHRLVALFALLTLVGGCTAAVPGTASAPVPPPGKGLDRYLGQKLTWESCDSPSYLKTDDDRDALTAQGVRCARLTVPLDYAKPDGDAITIAVLRRPASDPGARKGSLVVNPGGPGESGLATASRLYDDSGDSQVARYFDLVGFDPRGVAASEPAVRCLTGPERDAQRADDDELDATPAGVGKVEGEGKDFAAGCARRTGKGTAMLANLGSRDVARDMDVLRSALGDPKLNYLGFSYGTRIGTEYAEQFPDRVGRMVLDGAVDPDQDVVTELVAQGKGFADAFGTFAGWCVKRQDCALGRDEAKAVTAYQQLVRPLVHRPIEVGDGRRLSFADAITGTIAALYSPQTWEPLNTALVELRGNTSHTMMALADYYEERQPDGGYTNTQDAFTAIRCVDDPRVTDRAVVLRAQQQYKKAAPFTDDGGPPSPALDACAFWPVPSTGTPHLPKVDGLAPVLVISTTGDPATPYESGVHLAKALHGGLLTVEGTQHTAFLQGNTCVDRAAGRYLSGGDLPAAGARCS